MDPVPTIPAPDAIVLRRVGKHFQIRSKQRRFTFLGGWGSHRRTLKALDDIDLEIPEGEMLGIIGMNGSGKSTLLKIIAGITAPTLGEARVKGPIGSLIEIGAGFHPDLSGYENVYLNGTILGIGRSVASGRPRTVSR